MLCRNPDSSASGIRGVEDDGEWRLIEGRLIFQAQEALPQLAHQQFALRRGIAIQTSARCNHLVGQLSHLTVGRQDFG